MRRLILMLLLLLTGCGGGGEPEKLTVDQPYLLTWRESLTITGTFRDLASVSVSTDRPADRPASENQAQLKASGWSYTVSGLAIGDNTITVSGVDSAGKATRLTGIIHRYELPPPTPGITVLAHRGAALRVPENSLAATELAWMLGADAVEVDAMLSTDGRVVVIHDTSTERTASQSLVVEQSSSDELRAVELRGLDDPLFPVQRIPFLEEMIEAVPPGKKLLVDLKSEEIVLPLLQVFRDSGKLPQLMVQSFNRSQLIELKRALPELPVFLVTDVPNEEQLSAAERAAGIDGLNVPAQYVSAELVQKAHRLGFPIYCWTVDDPELALKMRSYGVDGILTRAPEQVGALLRSVPSGE